METNVIKIPDEHPDHFDNMPDGLEGYWWETEHLICVPLVIAKNEGDGSFSKFLRQIEAKDKLVFFCTIVSGKLDAILRAKGYGNAGTNDKYFGWFDGLAKDCRR